MRVVLRERPLAAAPVESVLEVRAREVLDGAVRTEVPRVDVRPLKERLGFGRAQLIT